MNDSMDEPEQLVEHFFRHESAGLVAVLARRFGFALIDVIEDMVQEAMLEALHTWRLKGIPQNPAAWLHRVARNRVIDDLRRQRIHALAIEREATSWNDATELVFSEDDLQDSLLRMIFTCCHPSLDRDSQLALTLKMLCGLGDVEVARALLISPAAAKKRVTRAKRRLQLNHVKLDLPAVELLSERLDAVHETLYLMFNEGYSATTGESPLRIDLSEEAARLCHLLCQSEVGSPVTRALLSLMLFHAARFDARMDLHGATIPLEMQDRSKWDQRMMMVAERWLQRSACGQEISRYHLEAGIARLHCRAESLQKTDWAAILVHYERLSRLFPSPMYELNRAIVLSRLHRFHQAEEVLQGLERESTLSEYPLLYCALADHLMRIGEPRQAIEYWEQALSIVHSQHEAEFIRTRIQTCSEIISPSTKNEA